MPDPVEVVAAVIERDGRYLITRRLEGTHLAGLWEFPGGKILSGEKPEDALRRELKEELGVEAAVGELIETVDWTYPEKRVRLLFFRCALAGEPAPLEGQEMRWIAAADLGSFHFPDADATLIARLSRR
ncbi:MAG: 8-oxo-dGTP diphosphatase MutT [Candidatus Rokubacteria bacterium]|nr:8-oxo-dGTP diphosphatase MutT [Candidatus Rokubacteria bacterium]